MALPASGDREALLDILAGALAFPEWFGHDWDALADCPGDLCWLEAPGDLLVAEEVRQFHDTPPNTWNTAAEILAQTCSDWRSRNKAFWVLTT
ncbi:MAG: barstar family protein [Gammaproteobacteria bacterium]|nr:barstar family protein [Gammaproteobacteria bacterium]